MESQNEWNKLSNGFEWHHASQGYFSNFEKVKDRNNDINCGG